MAPFLCCSLETTSTLLIDCTPIQNVSGVKNNKNFKSKINGQPARTYCIDRELCSVLCRRLDRRGVWGKRDTCVCMAEPLAVHLELSPPCSSALPQNKAKSFLNKKTIGMHPPPPGFHRFWYLNTVLSPCAPISLTHTHTEAP